MPRFGVGGATAEKPLGLAQEGGWWARTLGEGPNSVLRPWEMPLGLWEHLGVSRLPDWLPTGREAWREPVFVEHHTGTPPASPNPLRSAEGSPECQATRWHSLWAAPKDPSGMSSAGGGPGVPLSVLVGGLAVLGQDLERDTEQDSAPC